MAQHIDPAIASRIDAVVHLRGLSYADLARAVDVTPAAAWNWAKARCAVSLERLADIAKVLNVSPAYLAFGLGENVPVSDPFIVQESIPEDIVEIPEFKYGAIPAPIPVANWRISKQYVEGALNTRGECLLICQNYAMIQGKLAPGDRVFVKKCESGEIMNEGYYLVFQPFLPQIARITVSYEHGVKYFITRFSSLETKMYKSTDITIIGEVVGALSKVTFDF